MHEFSVCQFFPNEQYEYVRTYVSLEEAVEVFNHYITCVGALVGTTVRVIITDGDDSISAEWKRDKGIVFPPDVTEECKGQFIYE